MRFAESPSLVLCFVSTACWLVGWAVGVRQVAVVFHNTSGRATYAPDNVVGANAPGLSSAGRSVVVANHCALSLMALGIAGFLL
jgi:hypothetical protein